MQVFFFHALHFFFVIHQWSLDEHVSYCYFVHLSLCLHVLHDTAERMFVFIWSGIYVTLKVCKCKNLLFLLLSLPCPLSFDYFQSYLGNDGRKQIQKGFSFSVQVVTVISQARPSQEDAALHRQWMRSFLTFLSFYFQNKNVQKYKYSMWAKEKWGHF